MALDGTATLGGGATGTPRPKKSYPIIKRGEYRFQLWDINKKEVPAFQKAGTQTKLELQYVCVEEGPYYGRYQWAQVTPTLTRAAPGTKESNLHKHLKALVNGGEDFTDAQIADWRKNANDRLNALVDKNHPDYHPVFADIFVKVDNGRGVDEETGKPKQYNNIGDINAPSQDAALYVAYVPAEPELDPRNAGEDETLVCQYPDCTRVVRGWEGNDGWKSQVEWVNYQQEKYGSFYCGPHLKRVKEDLNNPDKVPF